MIIPLWAKDDDATMQDTIITSLGDGLVQGAPAVDHCTAVLQIERCTTRLGVHVGRGCGCRFAVYKSIQGNGSGAKGMRQGGGDCSLV